MDTKRIIANNIFTLRNQYNLTQWEFAQKLNIPITRGHISRIETGSHVPSADFIRAVADTFGVSANYLLGSNEYDTAVNILPKKELDLVFKYRKLPEPVQNKILELINSILNT